MKIILGQMDDWDKPLMFTMVVNDDVAAGVMRQLDAADKEHVFTFDILDPDDLEFALDTIKEFNREDD